MVAQVALKEVRLEARVTLRQKRLIKNAAGLLGTSVTDFVVRSAQEAATRAINEAKQLSLSGAANEAFVNALLNPPAPTEAARAAARQYKKRRGL